jgi:hypothetical protein
VGIVSVLALPGGLSPTRRQKRQVVAFGQHGIARDSHEPFRGAHGERQVQLHHRFETAVRQRVLGF